MKYFLVFVWIVFGWNVTWVTIRFATMCYLNANKEKQKDWDYIKVTNMAAGNLQLSILSFIALTCLYIFK